MNLTWLPVLILIVAANGAPVVLRGLLWRHAGRPLDGGRLWMDGRPWFGRSKTLRGVVAAVLTTGVVAPLIEVPVAMGALIGVFAMLGDLLASFIKRRAALPVSSRATGLDQIPESLLPALVVARPFELSLAEVAGIVAAFFVLDVVFSPVLHRLGLRHRPY